MEERIFFNPGEVVKVKQNIPNKPLMVVKSVDKSNTKYGDTVKPVFFGITCFWFATDGTLQESRFNTKDLIHHE